MHESKALTLGHVAPPLTARMLCQATDPRGERGAGAQGLEWVELLVRLSGMAEVAIALFAQSNSIVRDVVFG